MNYRLSFLLASFGLISCSDGIDRDPPFKIECEGQASSLTEAELVQIASRFVHVELSKIGQSDRLPEPRTPNVLAELYIGQLIKICKRCEVRIRPTFDYPTHFFVVDFSYDPETQPESDIPLYKTTYNLNPQSRESFSVTIDQCAVPQGIRFSSVLKNID